MTAEAKATAEAETGTDEGFGERKEVDLTAVAKTKAETEIVL